MRAVVLERRGAPEEALVVHNDWPLPGFAPIPLKTPKILGEDLSGVVVEAPEGSQFKPGDRVFAATGQQLSEQYGTYAEYVAVDEALCCAIPEGVGFQESGALPVSGLTALQALQAGMPLEGKRVLVHGGAGGVGGFAVQIAKAHGAHVTTTCSGRNVEFVTQQLGADAAINYTQGPWDAAAAAAGQRFDLIVDTIGGPYEPASLRLLARGGRLCSLGATGPGVARVSVWDMAKLLLNAGCRTLLGKLGLGPPYTFVMQQARGEDLRQLGELMAQGKLKVHLDRVWPLEEMAAAHAYAEQGHVRGKVGITINPAPSPLKPTTTQA